MTDTVGTTRKPRRARRWLVRGLLVLIVLLIAMIAIGPWIASRLAPGMIESAAASSIQGTVKVDRLSIGWFSAVQAGPIELIDPAGKSLAKVEVEAPITLWQVVGGRWWSADAIDLGTITVRGDAKLVRKRDGSTNLDAALAPRSAGAPGTGAKPQGGGGGAGGRTPDIKVRLVIEQLNATIRDEQADGTPGPELGVQNLAGTIDAAINQAGLVASGDLKVRSIAGATGSDTAIKFTVTAKQRTPSGAAGLVPGNIEQLDATFDATGVPTALVDAFAGLAGALESGLGPQAEVHARVNGNLKNATIAMSMSSSGARAEAAMKVVDGVLMAAAEGAPAASLVLDSTTFAARLPQAAAALEKAKGRVNLDAGPSVSVSINQLRLPIPAGIIGGKPLDLAAIDLRGSGAAIAVNIGAAAGEVTIPAPNQAAAAPQPFRTEPLVINIDARDLAGSVRITGGTSATLDGKSAGSLAIDVAAAGLLDERGSLRALSGNAIPATLSGNVKLDDVSTALLQPIVAATGLPIDLATDAGPVVSVSIAAASDVAAAPVSGSGLAAVPPTNLTAQLRSANLQADAAMKIDGAKLETTGEGIHLTMNSGAPLAARLLAGDAGKPGPLAFDGRGGVELTITKLAADLEALRGDAPLTALDADLQAALTDVRALVDLSTDAPDQPAAPAEPIDIERATMGIVLARGNAPRVTMDTRASHGGTPMTLTADVTADGLSKGAMPKATGLDMLLALRLAGKIEAASIPPSLLRVVPQAARYAPISPSERSALDAAVAQVVAGAIGTGANATITLAAPQGGAPGQVARLQFTTQAEGAGVDLWTRVLPAEAAITGGNIFLVADPASINPAIIAASPPAEGASPIELGARTKLWVQFPEPIVVPLKRDAAGAITPDFARGKEAVVRLAAEGDVVVGGLPVGSDPGPTPEAAPTPRLASVRLHKLVGDLRAPLAAMGDAAARSASRGSAKITTEARTGSGAPLAMVSIDAAATLDGGSPEALVTLADLNTANADALMGKPGLVSGALGDRAQANVRIAPVASAPGEFILRAELTSPTVAGATIVMARRADRITITEPAAITWTPAPAFINSMLTGGEQSLKISDTAPIVFNLSKLTIAAGAEGTGPLMPGVFDLDAQFSTPRLGLLVPQTGADGKSAGAARPLSMDQINGRVKWDASVAGKGDAGPGALDAEVTIAAVSGQSGPAAKPSRFTAQIRSLIDAKGNIQSDRALIDADVDLNRFPSIVIDELANQDGLLAESLGPEVSVVAKARNLTSAESGPRGALEATLVSDRASANLVGDIRRGRFVQTGPSRVQLMEIRPQLMDELAGGLPMIASLEKTPSDEPAVVEMTDLVIPLDKNMSRLSGTISVDLGVARFTTSSFMGSLLKAVGGRAEGQVGRKIEPFVVRIDKGVATYDRFRLPLGEFGIETKGQVDLVKRTVNLTTYVPFFAITDEGLGPIKLGLGGRLDVLDRNTLVPITISGGMDNPSAKIDGEMFLKEAAGNLIQTPGKIIEGIGDLLGGKKNEEPEKK